MAGQTTVHFFFLVVFFSGRTLCKYHNWCSCQNTNTNYYNPKKLRPEKKGTVVWPAMFFEPPEKLRPEKKKVQSSDWATDISQITVCRVKIRTHQLWMEKLWPEKKYDTVVWLSVVSKYENHQSQFNLRKFLLGFFILQKQWDPNFLLVCISFLLCMDLQPYSHD